MTNTRQDARRLLEVVQRQYPTGVPVEFLKSAYSERQSIQAEAEEVSRNDMPAKLLWAGSERSKILFVVDVASTLATGEVFSQPEGVLLKAVIEKGLKLSIQNISIVEVDSNENLHLESLAQSQDSKMLIVCGSQIANSLELACGQGEISSVANKRIMWTCAMSEILDDVTKKRQLWNDLQVVLREIESK